MAQELPVVKLSEDGEYLAYSDPSGCLKIWQTSNNILAQEYAPSSHLSATCTCISWGPTNSHRQELTATKKRKLTTDVVQSVQNLNLIAMGTATGSILLYSVKNADLYTQMADGHTDRVNGICWHPEGDSLYSCSSDHHIVQWSLTTSSVTQKWKSGRGEVFSISLCHTKQHLLTAGRVIQLWDLKTKEVLQTFHGHSTEVFNLIQIPNVRGTNGLPSNNIDATHSSVEGSYIISSAVGDNKISVRQITESTSVKNQKEIICSFALPEPSVYVDICPPKEDNQFFRLIAVTRSGKMVFFEHILNGCQKKPLKEKLTFQLRTKAVNNSKPRSLPIVVAGFAHERQRNIVIAYEDFLRPTFESLLPSELQSCMEREDPKLRKIQLEDSIIQTRQPIIGNNPKVLVPGLMMPSDPVRTRDQLKRRRSVEMSIEDRLKALGTDPKAETRHVPKADNMAVLLEQGLRSEDKTILNNVLQRTDYALIKNTLLRLKITAVLPLLQELGRRISGHAQSVINDSVWLRSVIQVHHSYLVAIPNIENIIRPLLNVLDVPSKKLEQSIVCKKNIDGTLFRVNVLRQFKDTNVHEPAVCEYEQPASEDDD